MSNGAECHTRSSRVMRQTGCEVSAGDHSTGPPPLASQPQWTDCCCASHRPVSSTEWYSLSPSTGTDRTSPFGKWSAPREHAKQLATISQVIHFAGSFRRDFTRKYFEGIDSYLDPYRLRMSDIYWLLGDFAWHEIQAVFRLTDTAGVAILVMPVVISSVEHLSVAGGIGNPFVGF